MLQSYLHHNCVLSDGESDDGMGHLISISNCGLAWHCVNHITDIISFTLHISPVR